MSKKVRKPRDLHVGWDLCFKTRVGKAGRYIVYGEVFIFGKKDIRRLREWLQRAEEWMEQK